MIPTPPRGFVATLLPLAATLALAAAPAIAQDATASTVRPAGIEKITEAGLREQASFFASDDCAGRYTSTPGQRRAAEHIAAHFERLGYEPLGDENADGTRSYFQSWPVERLRLDPDKTGVFLGKREHARGFGVISGRNRDDVDVAGRLIDCGYGAPEDLPPVVGEDEIPFVLMRTRSRPGARVEAQFMTGLGMLGKARSIGDRLTARGAKCIVFGLLVDDSGLGDFLNYCALNPDKPLITYGRDRGMAAMVEGMRVRVPMLFLSSALSVEALGSLGRDVDGASAGDRPAVAPQTAARIRVGVIDEDAFAWNVCAVQRGTDPQLAREAIVFSAHMDHMGTRLDGAIFHGADDNASGSASLCQIADAFAVAGPRRRSVILLSVSGEEEGLWGSKHYTDHPTWPIDDIVANVNIDMIGRIADLSGADEISITPSHRHRKYSSIARRAAELAPSFGLGLVGGDKFYERSDHYNFAVNDIPVVFFCDGEHEDYHQVSDTADKLDYRKIERVARLAFQVGHDVADADERPTEIGRQDGWLAADGDSAVEAAEAGPRRRRD